MEISISERLGHLTVRDDYDVIEGYAFNSRITSSADNGVTTESNTIGLMQFLEHGDPRFGGKSCAILTSDFVDEDERYPYRSSDHVRKDISGAILLTANAANADNADQTQRDQVVTMRRIGFIRLHCPEFPMPIPAQQELEDGIVDWGSVMIKTMRELLYRA
ncbi:unnamed protein product [Phytophthora fragariaefolia]|uniref:Unnamed protein product n=1 Tax=Phytophthora fragariaefolia TaxID=1490495 RepID=A0A9W7CR62_9STRA|nr:unnamed protein product [Phytophthora fragariaefolia]